MTAGTGRGRSSRAALRDLAPLLLLFPQPSMYDSRPVRRYHFILVRGQAPNRAVRVQASHRGQHSRWHGISMRFGKSGSAGQPASGSKDVIASGTNRGEPRCYLGSKIRETGAEILTEVGNPGDDGYGDQTRDQAVFDGSRSALRFAKEGRFYLTHDLTPDEKIFRTRNPAIPRS